MSTTNSTIFTIRLQVLSKGDTAGVASADPDEVLQDGGGFVTDVKTYTPQTSPIAQNVNADLSLSTVPVVALVALATHPREFLLPLENSTLPDSQINPRSESDIRTLLTGEEQSNFVTTRAVIKPESMSFDISNVPLRDAGASNDPSANGNSDLEKVQTDRPDLSSVDQSKHSLDLVNAGLGAPKEAPPPTLFSDGDDFIDFNDPNRRAGSFLDGSQYYAGGGNDVVILPSDANVARQIGYDLAYQFRTINGYFVDGFHGGPGNDLIFGGRFPNVIFGDSGDDTIVGANDDDLIYGGSGNDTLFGQGGADNIYGGEGDDSIDGGGGQNSIEGGPGNDVIFAGGTNSFVDGGPGNDVIVGVPGADFMLLGGDGDDLIFGNGGNDYIDGGAGNDVLFGNNDTNPSGNDEVHGGSGDDVIAYQPSAAAILDGGPGNEDQLSLQFVSNTTYTAGSGPQVSNMEIVFLGDANNTLSIDAAGLDAITDANHQLAVGGGTSSTVDLHGIWNLALSTPEFSQYAAPTGEQIFIQAGININFIP